MRILFDHQIYSNQKYGGISRYFYELAKGLTSLGEECTNSIFLSDNEFVQDKTMFTAREMPSVNFKGKGALKKYLNRKVSEKIMRRGNFDLLHPTYYDTYFLGKKPTSLPFVVTFYDLIHEKFGEKFPGSLKDLDKVIADRKALIKEASRVIAISESTKNDIIEFYGVDPAKIDVTYLASSMPSTNLLKSDELGPYILYVGNRSDYKNFRNYAESIRPLLVKEPTLRLVCAGGGELSQSEIEFINSLHLSRQIIQMPINDSILAKLYHNAICFVFPSLYEGFGIPALEAFSCGCPAILSDRSSLPEVGADAALYVNPEDKADMLDKTERFFYDDQMRQAYTARGLDQVKRFSWDRMAIETLNIYKGAL
ncbi:glycosyltransferase family 1 protein [Dyadobacter sp. CY347]|uniref:glycosyltransferase family 4 protein n=1 Tax=Dyadobacter sp. CY347 TaxID=2909336 RepID=UPI001F1883B0|nr:glycosyltransferase family 1 protein [Dyadobacter sp. CY347]MCF2491096.1 glycosyltransferase family 4 protein [Dyadobacter sp. CY347]